MILINLLPHREAARKKRQDIFNITLGASALGGGLIAGVLFLWIQAQLSSQQYLNAILTQEIKTLDNQIKEIAALEAEIAALRARQQAVENLQADRNMPIHLLSELTRQIPEGVFVTSMKQVDQSVTLNGTAQSQERVSELLRNLAYRATWFSQPQLVEIVAGKLTLSKQDQRTVFNFIMRVRVQRASEVQKAGGAEPSAGAPPVPAKK